MSVRSGCSPIAPRHDPVNVLTNGKRHRTVGSCARRRPPCPRAAPSASTNPRDRRRARATQDRTTRRTRAPEYERQPAARHAGPSEASAKSTGTTTTRKSPMSITINGASNASGATSNADDTSTSRHSSRVAGARRIRRIDGEPTPRPMRTLASATKTIITNAAIEPFSL